MSKPEGTIFCKHKSKRGVECGLAMREAFWGITREDKEQWRYVCVKDGYHRIFHDGKEVNSFST